jgi:hypothetical protein
MAGIQDDIRMKEARKIVLDKRLPNGRWLRETRWPSGTYSSFGTIGREDKWITLTAMRVMTDTGSRR